MLKREWGAESNGKQPHLFIPDKAAALVTEFAVEDLSLSRTAIFVTEFAVEGLLLSRIATLVLEVAVKDLPSTELQPWFLRLQ